MAKNKKFLHTFRNVLVIVSTVLMIAVLVLQCLEINEYNIWDHIQSTLKAQFQPEPVPAAPAASPAPPAGEPAAAAAQAQQ